MKNRFTIMQIRYHIHDMRYLIYHMTVMLLSEITHFIKII